MAFSLLLHALDPKPTRQQLEDISRKVPPVAKADCAFILKDWFGIVASGLLREDAMAFQNGLREIGITTDIVDDLEIPALHPDFRCQRFDLELGKITLTTAMNRKQVRRKEELVFVAIGRIIRDKVSKTSVREPFRNYSGSHDYEPAVRVTSTEYIPTEFFRIDFFFSSDPYRISLEIDKETVLFSGERSIRMKNTLDLTVLMVDLQTLLPPERMNLALRELSLLRVYPSMHAYEEELRWSFYRLGAKG